MGEQTLKWRDRNLADVSKIIFCVPEMNQSIMGVELSSTNGKPTANCPVQLAGGSLQQVVIEAPTRSLLPFVLCHHNGSPIP